MPRMVPSPWFIAHVFPVLSIARVAGDLEGLQRKLPLVSSVDVLDKVWGAPRFPPPSVHENYTAVIWM